MQRLKVAWQVPKGCSAPLSSVPAGAQLLRVTPLRSNGGILQEASCSDSSNKAEQAWGIPFSPEEFIYEAVQRGHPKAFSKLVPKFLKEAIVDNFGSKLSLSELASARAQWFARWTKRAKELSQKEASFKAELPEHVRKILCPKRLLLWKEILQELGYEDMAVFEEISSGTKLAGEVPACGIFEKKFKSADLTIDQLASMGLSDRRKNFHRCASSGDSEIDMAVYEKTLEEVSMGWAKGPISYDKLPAGAVLSRRFGLRQPGKVRLIDDLTGSKVNSTVQTSESPKPQSVDYIGAMLLQALQLEGGLELRGRTYDLKSAYKQLAVAQSSLDFAYVVVFNPHSRQPEIFQLLAAPFGATRSVYSFLRIIHSVWYIGVAALKIVWSHFFDDFVVFCKAGHESYTGNTVELLFKLLGWKFAEDGEKAMEFSKVFTALGVQLQLSGASRGSVEFANTEKRKAELLDTISNILTKGSLTLVEAQKLRGRMQFMDGQLFGRMGRLCMRAVTEHAFVKKNVKLNKGTRESLERFSLFLAHSEPRRLRANSGEAWFIYTDACFERDNKSWPCGLGGVLVGPSGICESFFSICLQQQFMELLGSETKKTIIFEAELLALVLAFALWKPQLTSVPVICFVDNNSARDVAISGVGRNQVAGRLISFLLKLEMSVCAFPWYARVPSPSNISDDPSRGDTSFLTSMGARQIETEIVLKQIMEVLAESADKEE